MDYFEQLPDHVLLHIIDLVSDDINAMFRLRTLSRRFNSLITMKTQHLFLKVDKLEKIFHTCWEIDYSYYFSNNLSWARSTTMSPTTTNSPSQNLSLCCCFNHVTKLVIELPTRGGNGGMTLLPVHRAKFMIKATYGKNLKTCVILMYSTRYNNCDDLFYMPDILYIQSCFDFMEGKIELTCSLLQKYAYSLASKLLPRLENLVSLVVKNGEGDLEMVMDKEGIRECREIVYANIVAPMAGVRYRIRAKRDASIGNGEGRGQETMLLGVVVGPHYKKFDDVEEANLARRAFGSGVHGIAVEKMIQNSCYFDSKPFG